MLDLEPYVNAVLSAHHNPTFRDASYNQLCDSLLEEFDGFWQHAILHAKDQNIWPGWLLYHLQGTNLTCLLRSLEKV